MRPLARVASSVLPSVLVAVACGGDEAGAPAESITPGRCGQGGRRRAVQKSNKSRAVGKIRYWWGWFGAGKLQLLIATPALIVLGIINKRMWLFPLAHWGARTWLRACGATVKVTGQENLDPNRSYVFASNHRSYLDTATLFFYAGQKMGLVAKRELLKVPVLGQGMNYVNIIAIDHSNPERALRSME